MPISNFGHSISVLRYFFEIDLRLSEFPLVWYVPNFEPKSYSRSDKRTVALIAYLPSFSVRKASSLHVYFRIKSLYTTNKKY